MSSLVTYKPLKMGDYTYPPWAQVFAIAATLVPIGIIFLGIVLNFHESGYVRVNLLSFDGHAHLDVLFILISKEHGA